MALGLSAASSLNCFKRDIGFSLVAPQPSSKPRTADNAVELANVPISLIVASGLEVLDQLFRGSHILEVEAFQLVD